MTDRRDNTTPLEQMRHFADHAKRFDRSIFDDDTAFADWVQSRARALLAAQEPRPEPTENEDAHWLRCWGGDEMARGNVSNAQRFVEIADLLDAATSPAQAAPKHEHQPGDILCRQCDYEQSNAATPTVEIDERQLRESFEQFCARDCSPGAFTSEWYWRIWRESALAERQRAADDVFDLVVDMTVAIESLLYPDLADKRCDPKQVNERALKWIASAMSAQGDA